MFRNLSFFGDDAWSKRATPLKAFVSFLLLLLSGNMDQFVDGPGFFEAVLVAEVGGIEVHFFAGGADHGSFVFAAWSPAYILNCFHCCILS